MYDHRFSQNILHPKPVGQKSCKSKAMVAEQWRQITCVFRMRTAIRIVMAVGIRKRIFPGAGAAAAFVNMKTKNPPAADRCSFRQPADLCPHQYTAGQLVKSRLSTDRTAADHKVKD